VAELLGKVGVTIVGVLSTLLIWWLLDLAFSFLLKTT